MSTRQIVLLGGPCDLTRMVVQDGYHREVLVPVYSTPPGPHFTSAHAPLGGGFSTARYVETTRLRFNNTYVYEYEGMR